MYNNVVEKQRLIADGKLNLTENVETFLQRINESNNNAFLAVFDDVAVHAKNIQTKILDGNHGKLAGLVISVKDLISVKDHPLTCSSRILSNHKAIFDATIITKLRDADAIIIGKTNCDEFGMGSSNENSAFGNVKNSFNDQYVSGGSSGGSAVSVASKLCDASIGTDTGGSIRQPSAFNGIYGLKPTYGRVSRFGLTSYASSFDTIGPIASNTTDLSLILQIISGFDENDSTSLDVDTPDFMSADLNKKFRIGLPKEYFIEGIDPEIKERVIDLSNKLQKAGHEVIEISLPHTEYVISTYYILTTAEASANLERYDGIRYGERAKGYTDFKSLYSKSRSNGFGDEVKRRILLGTYVLSSGYYDAYFKKAQKVRRLIKEDFDSAFENIDLIMTPTTPTSAFKFGENSDDPVKMYLSDIFTTASNLAGIPAINIPAGKNKSGLPIGIQFMAPLFMETNLLNISSIIENSF